MGNGCCNPNFRLAPNARACKGASQEVTSHAPGSVGYVREWTFALSSELSLWELESQWTPEFSENNCRGQNPLDWEVPYIIEKLLERRCLKWARMTHLDTYNISYGQKKGRKSNWQFDSRPLKVEIRLDFHACRWRATYCWKSFNKG
jgi:hypothetical protein